MLRRFTGLLALVLASVLGSSAGTSSAADSGWQPEDVMHTAVSLSDVMARYERGSGKPGPGYARRTERYRASARGTTFTAEAVIRDGDYAVTAVAGGATYRSGRGAGARWRRTPAGVVRIVASDVQADNLDRWPLAAIGFDPSACGVAGETAGPGKAYVLACTPAGDVTHWLYVDAEAGSIVREVTRDGMRVRSFVFDDLRVTDGLLRPYAWHAGGDGDPLDVVVEDVTERAVAAAEVAIPASVTEASFAAPSDRVVRVPATFVGNRITIDVTIDGKRATFALDTGTTQLLIDGGAAHRLGLAETLDHVTARAMDVGELHATDAPLLTVGLGGFGFDGLLGNEFFLGHVVHIDFHRKILEIVPHDRFSAPPEADAIPISCAEGMPLASGSIDGIAGDRFAMDIGSFALVVPRYFADHRAGGKPLRATPIGGRYDPHYLEGSIATERVTLSDVFFGPYRIRDGVAYLEDGDPARDLDIPLDAIVGTSVLADLELWFDYDNNVVYAKPY